LGSLLCMGLKGLSDGLFDVEVRGVDHGIAKVGCRVGDVLVNRDPVDLALNLGRGIFQVVVDQPRPAAVPAGHRRGPLADCPV
jgi:hypothetical protein